MAKEKIRKIATLIKSFLGERNIQVEKIIIFGSYATGNYKKDSDVDIAIISKDFEGKDIFQKAEMLKGLKWFLTERFMLPFDIIPLSLKELQESSSMIAEFVKEGRTL